MNIYLSNPALICGAGSTAEEFYDSITTGNQKGIKKVTTTLAGEEGAKTFFAGHIDDEKLTPTGSKYDMRFLQVMDAALNQLQKTAEKAVSKYGAERVAVCIGQCDNGSYLSLKAHQQFFGTGSFAPDYDLKAQGADYPATFAAEKLGVKGPALSFATACSSSATAIIKAKELIKAGIVDAAIAGGADITSDTVLLGFNSLEAIDTEKISNPFSASRKGITLGEGAAFFVLSKDDLENTGILLAGSGESSDAGHMTAPLADGTGAKQAMEQALKDADLKPQQIDYINLHGTGTHLNDSMEGKGVDLVFGEYKVPVSTTKPMTGHTLGAAAALELAACFMTIKNQKLPVQIWDGQQDPEIPQLNIVTCPASHTPVTPERPVKICMSNSFAFGGCNASLIIREV